MEKTLFLLSQRPEMKMLEVGNKIRRAVKDCLHFQSQKNISLHEFLGYKFSLTTKNANKVEMYKFRLLELK